MSEVIEKVCARKFVPRLAVLSGPSFAAEAAKGEPTAVELPSSDASVASELQREFAAPYFRIYTTNDGLGVEMAAATKNVPPIPAGLCQRTQLPSNPPPPPPHPPPPPPT